MAKYINDIVQNSKGLKLTLQFFLACATKHQGQKKQAIFLLQYPTKMALLRLFCKCSNHLHTYSTVLPRTSAIAFRPSALQNASRQRQWISSKKKALPFEVDTASINKDVLVYSNKNERFYSMLSFFGCAQFAFWAYLALFSFQNLRDVPEESSTDTSWWRRIIAKENKYKNGISILCFSLGYLVLCFTLMYPARAVRTLWLLKGGNSVRLSTFSVLKRYQTLTVPVTNVTCLQSRADATAHIPLKIRGKWFFFLLDKEGKFHNTELFDFAIGLNRSLK